MATCFSWINISGDENTIRMIENVIEKAEPAENLFISFIGIPEHLTEEEFKTGEHYHNWIGTTSGWFNDADINYDGDSITISMESTWSPPDDFFIRFCKMYKLSGTIEYDESSCDFCGTTTCSWDGDNFNTKEEIYGYLEGIYKLRDIFWDEVESRLESAMEDEDMTIDDFMSDFQVMTDENTKEYFVTDEDKEELIRLYNEEKLKYNDENDDDTEGE